MMTRKDFEALAASLARAQNAASNPAIRAGVALATIKVAAALAPSNPRFDRQRFMKAAVLKPFAIE